MKKTSLFAFFLLFVSFFSTINAQVTIGTGTAFSEKYPFNDFYNYSWSNVIYLSNEINSSGNLTSVAFYVDNSPSNVVMNNQRIYVRHTSASAVTSTNYPTTAGFTLVYDGSITYNGSGWKTINLTSPFTYNGTSNLEFLFENRNGAYTVNYPYFRYTTTPSGTANYRLKRDYYDSYFPENCPAYCGSINNIPNIQMTFQSCPFSIGTTSTSTSSVLPGNTASVSISGQEPTASIQWQSSIDNVNFTSITGATNSTYSEAINETRYYRAILTTSTCSKISNTVTVSIDLSTMVTKSIGAGTSTSQNQPFNHLYNYNWSNMIYKASEINSSGKLTRIAVNVGNSPTGFTAQNQQIYVRHTTATSYPNSTYPTTAGFTLVYDGSITYNGSGWKEIVLNGNFIYNGTDNLEFLFENHSGVSSYYYPMFLYESGTQAEYRVRKNNLDAAFPTAGMGTSVYYKNLMNIQLKFIPCSVSSGTINTSNTTFCTGGTTTLTLSNQTSGTSIQWQVSSDNTTWTNTGNTASTSNTTLAITSQTGTKYYRAIATLSGCSATSSVQTITVTPASVAGTIAITTGSNSYCSTTNSTTLTLSGNTGTIQWQSSTDNVTFSNITTNGTGSTYTATNLTTTTYYRAVVTSGGCSSATTNTQTISVTEVNAGTAVVSPSTILEGESTTLSISNQTAGASIQWKKSLDNGVTFTSIEGATATSYFATSLTATTLFKAEVSLNSCVVSTNVVTVTVDASNMITVNIGNGTSSTEKYPFNGYYDYSWSSVIYKANEINTTGALSRISFYVNNSPVNETMNNQKIYVRHTTATEQTDVNYPTTQGFTLVYDGSITYNGTGWKEIVFQTPFEYNGVSNLEFLFENRDGSSSTTYPTFRYQTGQSEYRIKRDYKIGSFPTANSGLAGKYSYLLNTKFKFTPCSINAGTIASNLATVIIGNTFNLSLTGQQAGATIQWQSSWDNINFQVIANQTGTTCNVTMSATTMYFRAVVTSGCSKFTNVISVSPSACFAEVNSIGTANLETERYPFNGFYNYSWVNVIYKPSEVGQAGKLISAAFNVLNNPVNFVMNKQRIYARHTTRTEYQDTIYPDTIGYKLIFDGTITYNGSGWKELPFTTPFEYDGINNLEFLFENRDGSWGSGYPVFAFSDNQDGYRVRRDYRDTDFPVLCENCRRFRNVPNIKIKHLPLENVGGVVTASATEVCAGVPSVLTLNNPLNGASIQWQKSTNNVDFTDVQNQTAINFSTEAITSKNYYRTKLQKLDCEIYTNSIAIDLLNFSDNTVLYNEIEEKGQITIDLNCSNTNNGPFHYLISDKPIASLMDQYNAIKDSLGPDPDDSLYFFRGEYPEKTHVFTDLKMGKYYISVYDSKATKIFDNIYSVGFNSRSLISTTMKLEGNISKAIEQNAKGTFDIYMTESTKGEIKFQIKDPLSSKYVGVLNSTDNLLSQSNLKYGFKIIEGVVYTIENGVQNSVSKSINENSELKLLQENGIIRYIIDNTIVKSLNLDESYTYKIGLGITEIGDEIQTFPSKLSTSKFYFSIKNTESFTCNNGKGGFSFKAENAAKVQVPYTWKVYKDGILLSESTTPTVQTITQFNELTTGAGNYKIIGHSDYGSGYNFSKEIFIGY